MVKPHKKSNPARPLFAAAPPPSTPLPSGPQVAPLNPVATIDDPPPAGPKPRHDGWTLHKQRQFCDMLAARHPVEEAAAAVGLSARAAYGLRARDPEFAAAWNEARDSVRQALIDKALTYAFHGRVTRIYKNGKLVGDRRRQSPALVLAAVKRMRSPKLLGNPTVLAAAADFGICMELLYHGLAYPDPEATEPAAPVTPKNHDGRGWSPATQRAFCEALAELGNVEKACESIGKARSIAYAERNHPDCRAFAIGWDAALLVASDQLIDMAQDLADKGDIEEVARFGRIVSRSRILSTQAMLATAETVDALKLPTRQREVELIIKQEGTSFAWFIAPEVAPDEGLEHEVAPEPEPVLQAA